MEYGVAVCPAVPRRVGAAEPPEQVVYQRARVLDGHREQLRGEEADEHERAQEGAEAECRGISTGTGKPV